MTLPPPLRSNARVSTSPDSRPYRPTLTVALIFVFVLVIAPYVNRLAPLFGGSAEEDRSDDPFGALQNLQPLADLLFDDFAFELIAVLAFITVMRWWRLLQFEPYPLRPRAFGALPIATAALFTVATLIGVIATPRPDWRLLALQAAFMLVVAVIEEFCWRGVAVIGLRGSGVPEWLVWLLTSAGFAAMHFLNLFAGADVEGTLGQVVFTFLLGSACYLARRVAGIWLAVAVHFTNNYLQVAASGSAESPLFDLVNATAIGGQALMALALPMTIVVLILEARRTRRASRSAMATPSG
ncbi:CPBP family intramembrane glutamic endopeptidase [Microbacterium hydrocarbonoxydans]|uniref:CPBP family intramembrane glutamic endopeptidase n=1 Tax=Microbacterium hydrocarbonoxydans TaxID=273678 RepID=UPI00203D0567|nr:CPBP family intramembrane glutamic endopeptidase [Microbacterium hydrocarbonoxydans]MCM3781149.1 CPBP family intramembrane metalloprotease [Microbacterium hydrocarbonoxydans]